MSQINPGDVIRINTDPPFSDAAGVATDPDTVELLVRRRGQPPKTYTYLQDDEIVREGTGKFHADILIDKPGTWYARWQGTGDVVASEELEFTAVSHFA